MYVCLSELVEPAGGEAQVWGRRGAFSAFLSVWASPDFPIGGFLELDGARGAAPVISPPARPPPPGASTPTFLRAAAAAEKAGL